MHTPQQKTIWVQDPSFMSVLLSGTGQNTDLAGFYGECSAVAISPCIKTAAFGVFGGVERSTIDLTQQEHNATYLPTSIFNI
jgi:hypothetical protein